MAILTLARQVGSGSKEIGQSVARTLDYQYIDKNEILQSMKAVGEKWEALAESFDERYPKLLDRRDSSFAGFVALAQWVILQYALSDNVVIISRGSNQLLKGIPYAFRVRVIAPIEQRVERIMERERVSRAIAELLIKKADYEMSRFINYIYEKHWDDPAEYDTVVDTGIASISQIADNLSKELVKRDSLATEDAKRTLALTAKAHEIYASLLVNPKLHIPIIDVHPEGQALVLRGVANDSDVAEQIEDVARRLAGDIPIKVDIHSRR